MSQDHYFSAEPESGYREKQLTIQLAGNNVAVTTASGTFSPQGLDLGSKILLDRIELAPKQGNLLDLGCGWGPIAIALAQHNPEAIVYAIDTNLRSLQLTTKNATGLGLSNIRALNPGDLPKELRFDAIWSNPPIRIGKNELHKLLLSYLRRLNQSGSCYLVVQKHLGADSLQRWLSENLDKSYSVSRLDSVKGYRILEILRS